MDVTVADLATAINIMWMLVAGFLVFFMQAGFALLTLQLPAAWLLSIWRARRLCIVLRQIGSGGTRTTRADGQ